jgi:ubiquinone/menaquinone biosynthesis C-methylase UbiE
MHNHNHDVCPLAKAKKLDNFYRKLIHNPKRILGNYIKEGMTVLDFGCGPGMFAMELAKMVGKNGKVNAVDLQQGMLDILQSKIKGTELEKRIVLHKCEKDTISVKENIDFALAFFVAHEVPDQKHFFEEVYSILNPSGKLIMIEPNKPVSKEEFGASIEIAKSIGFKIDRSIKVLFSRGIVLQK